MFVHNGVSRATTAVLLVGTASEYGVDQREIRVVRGGFEISERLAGLVYPENKTPKRGRTSGNRAAKKQSSATNKE